MSTELKDIFLKLVRLGIGHLESTENTEIHQLNTEDWEALKALAEEQGLLAIVLDGLDRLNARGVAVQMPKKAWLEWIGEVLQDEYRYKLYRRAIAEMAAFYNSHGFKMMVLKGYACSLNWPKPEHRPTGDIDIWQFGAYREADSALAAEKKVQIDTREHHHTVFYWRDFMVENHYDFINVHHHRSNAEFEKILKKLGEDDSHFVELYGEKVCLPSPNLHSLFLIKHLMLHFASGKISLRQVLDWGFFVKAHGSEVDWMMVLEVLDRFGMRKMFDIINAICVDDLGFASDLFTPAEVDSVLKGRVLNEILSPEFVGKTPSSLIPRVAFKYRRWRANEWKHRLCYKDSMWSAFWTGVWNHLLKPDSI